jgi:hypothetical protein
MEMEMLMQNDFKTITGILDRNGIGYETRKDETGSDLTIYGGYAGFYTTLTFDVEGKLVNIGAWE